MQWNRERLNVLCNVLMAVRVLYQKIKPWMKLKGKTTVITN